MQLLFSEELGIVIEVPTANKSAAHDVLQRHNVVYEVLGHTITESTVAITVNDEMVLDNVSMLDLRDVWEATSFALDKLQANPDCVEQEQVLSSPQSLRPPSPSPSPSLSYSLVWSPPKTHATLQSEPRGPTAVYE